MPCQTPTPSSLADQVQAPTKQLLARDFDRRFEQLNDRIDQQKTSFDAAVATLNQALSDLAKQSVAHRVSLPFAPTLDGNWVSGTTSPPNTFLVNNQGSASIATGNMPVALPNLPRIEVFRTSSDFKPSLPLGVFLTVSLERTGLNDAKAEAVVDLQAGGSGFGNANSQGGPIPGRELVDNNLFKYSIFSFLFVTTPSSLPLGFPLSVPQGLVVLKSFQVDCISA
jgi:hypothetical protein